VVKFTNTQDAWDTVAGFLAPASWVLTHERLASRDAGEAHAPRGVAR
jgi:hypothetical protein